MRVEARLPSRLGRARVRSPENHATSASAADVRRDPDRERRREATATSEDGTPPRGPGRRCLGKKKSLAVTARL